MIWILSPLIFLILLAPWLLMASIFIEVDSRIPFARLRWATVGNVSIWYDSEWWIRYNVLFFDKTVAIGSINKSGRKLVSKKAGRKRSKPNPFKQIRRVRNMFRACKVIEWQLAIDTGDNTVNALWFPMNFLPQAAGHVKVNFSGENYFLWKCRCRPWKILFAYLR